MLLLSYSIIWLISSMYKYIYAETSYTPPQTTCCWTLASRSESSWSFLMNFYETAFQYLTIFRYFSTLAPVLILVWDFYWAMKWTWKLFACNTSPFPPWSFLVFWICWAEFWKRIINYFSFSTEVSLTIKVQPLFAYRSWQGSRWSSCVTVNILDFGIAVLD